MMIEKEHTNLSIEKQCALLAVSRSSMYYVPTQESQETLTILRYLDEQYLRTPFYGYRKLAALLSTEGYQINEKKYAG